MTDTQRRFHVFDMDGTLIDSMPYWENLMINYLDERSISYPDDLLVTITPMGLDAVADYFRNVLGCRETKEEFIKMLNEAATEQYKHFIPAKPGAGDYLKKLRGAGIRTSMLTASPHLFMDPCMKRLGFDRLLDPMVSTDDIGITKADPEIYLRLASMLGCGCSDICFYDDNLIALRAASEAGCETVAVYDEASSSSFAEASAAADRHIYSFSELL